MRLVILLIAGVVSVCTALEISGDRPVREERQLLRFRNRNNPREQEQADHAQRRIQVRPPLGDRRNNNEWSSDWDIPQGNVNPNPLKVRQQPMNEQKQRFEPAFSSQQNWEGFDSGSNWTPSEQDYRQVAQKQFHKEEKTNSYKNHHEAPYPGNNWTPTEQEYRPATQKQLHKEEKTNSYKSHHEAPYPGEPNHDFAKEQFDSTSRPRNPNFQTFKNTPDDEFHETPRPKKAESSSPNLGVHQANPVALRETDDESFELPIFRNRQEPQRSFERPNRPYEEDQDSFTPQKFNSFDDFPSSPNFRFRPDELPSTKEPQKFSNQPQRFRSKEPAQFDRHPEEFSGFKPNLKPNNFGFDDNGEEIRSDKNERPHFGHIDTNRPGPNFRETDEFNVNSEAAAFQPLTPNRPINQRRPNNQEKRIPPGKRPLAQSPPNQQPQQPEQNERQVFRPRLPENNGQRPRPNAAQPGRPPIPGLDTIRNLMGINGRPQPLRPNRPPRPNRVQPVTSGAPDGFSDFESPLSNQGDQKETPVGNGNFFDGPINGNFKNLPNFPGLSSRQQTNNHEPMEHRGLDRISSKDGAALTDTTTWTPVVSETEAVTVVSVSDVPPAKPVKQQANERKRVQNPRIGAYKQRLEAMRERAKQKSQSQIQSRQDDVTELSETPLPTTTTTTTTTTQRTTSSRPKYPTRFQQRTSTTTTSTTETTQSRKVASSSVISRRSDNMEDREESLESTSANPTMTEGEKAVTQILVSESSTENAVTESSLATEGKVPQDNADDQKLEYSDGFFSAKKSTASRRRPVAKSTEDETHRQSWFIANQPYISADLISDGLFSLSPKSSKE